MYICMISKNIKEYNIYSLLYTEIGIIHLTPIFPVIPSHYLQVICAPRIILGDFYTIFDKICNMQMIKKSCRAGRLAEPGKREGREAVVSQK